MKACFGQYEVCLGTEERQFIDSAFGLKRKDTGTLRGLLVWLWLTGSVLVGQQLQWHVTDRLVAPSFRSWGHREEKKKKDNRDCGLSQVITVPHAVVVLTFPDNPVS